MKQKNSDKQYVVGQLTGGNSTCINPQETNRYGRFDIAYEAGMQKWLDPDSVAGTPPGNPPGLGTGGGNSGGGSGGGSGNNPGSGGGSPPPATPAPPPALPPTAPPATPARIDYIASYKPSSKATPKALAIAPPKAAPWLTHTIELPPWDASKAASSPENSIGTGRAVAQTGSVESTQKLLQWHRSASNSQLAALRFVSPAAFGVRLGVYVESLPQGAVVRAYGNKDDEREEIHWKQLQAMQQLHARDKDASAQSIHT